MATARELFDLLQQQKNSARYYSSGYRPDQPFDENQGEAYRQALIELFSFTPMCYSCHERRADGCLRGRDGYGISGWFCAQHFPADTVMQRTTPEGVTWEEFYKLTAPKVSSEELWATLKGVEDGSITLSHGDVGYSGNVPYAASNGWELVVFNDCDEWDYLDSAKTPDGRIITYYELCLFYPDLAEYRPQGEIAATAYNLAP